MNSSASIMGNISASKYVIAVVIFLSFFLLASVLSRFLRKYLKKKINKDLRETTIKIIFYLALIIGLATVFTFLGFNPKGLLVTGGIAGIALGFASQNMLSNMIAGLFLMIERPIKIGNNVCIESNQKMEGFVEDIRILSTTLRTYTGHFVRIPNSQVFTSNIINYVTNTVRRFEYIVNVRLDEDIEKVIDIISDAIYKHPFALKRPASEVYVYNISEYAVSIKIKAWAPSSEWYYVKTELLAKIKAALDAEGIEIPFPQRVIYVVNNTDNTDSNIKHLVDAD